MTYYEKENLREDILILKYLNQLMIDKGVSHEEYLKKLEKHKKRIRRNLKNIYERDEEREMIFHAAEDGTSWIKKEWYDSYFTDEEKEDYIESNWITINSAYDCTALPYTQSISIFNIDTSFGKRAVVYHSIGLDV